MQLFPAIDLREGHCVRLLKGDFERETRYDVDPIELASGYRDLGAEWLHVVDLDGAKRGTPVNLDLIARLQATTGLRVQLGGGVRSRASLERAVEVASRVVIGSLAVSEPETVAGWLGEFGPERVTLGLDVRLDSNGTPVVATHGWTRASGLALDDAIARYIDVGLKHVLCTDIDRDGALAGPNTALYRRCVERWPAIAFQASGGVRNLGDLTSLAASGVAATVSGKALLEGKLTAEEIQPFLRGA